MINTDDFDLIIGLEIHIQTNTKSKMFCACPTGYFQKDPNTHVCPVCLGLPGALPVPNKRAIELCILMGLATQCNIDKEIYFDRKHYYYPDLPKGYQISQYKRAICTNGKVEIPSGEIIEIERIHQEEDVAKSTHHMEGNKEYTLVDYNKSGVPLIEIVTKPCIKTAKDAKDFATAIRQIARYLGISDADMEKGQMRCEPNISLQRKGTWEYIDGKILPKNDCKLNSKVEIKNIGSITAVEKSIEYEVTRILQDLRENKEIIQQTRGWNATKGITEFQRSKESAEDYRYMPEPDIPVIEVSQEDLERIGKELTELPHQKTVRYTETLGISQYSAEVISATKDNADYFEKLLEILSKELNTKEAAIEASNWIMGPLYSLSNTKGCAITELKIDMNSLAILILSFKQGLLSKNAAETILKESVENNKDLLAELNVLKDERGKFTNNIEDIIKKVISENNKAVEDFKSGKDASIGFLIGKVMQESKGTANANDVKDIIFKLLENEN